MKSFFASDTKYKIQNIEKNKFLFKENQQKYQMHNNIIVRSLNWNIYITHDHIFNNKKNNKENDQNQIVIISYFQNTSLI